MEARGGYFVRLENLDGLDLVGLARQALASEGVGPEGMSLLVGVHPRRKVVHVTYDAPSLRGTAAARWFSEHPALACLLSCRLPVVVQSYAIEPDRFEEVFTYANGRRVGGERLEYAAVELPEDAERDDEAFARVTRHWPLGHLAYVFGLKREELLHLAQVPAVRLSLEESRGAERLGRLLNPQAPQEAGWGSAPRLGKA